MASLIYPRMRFWNNDNTLLSGGLVYCYAAGTSTPQTTYSDYALTTPNAYPVVLDSKGEAAIYVSGIVKFNVLDANGVQVTGYPMDYLSVGSGTAGGGTTWGGTSGGTTTAFTLTPTQLWLAYADGMMIAFRANAANTSAASTMAVSGLAALPMKMGGSISSPTAMPIGGLIINNMYIGIVENTAGTQAIRITPYDATSVNGDTIQGAISAYVGTVSLPGIYLGTNTSTGLYNIGANNDGYAVSGVKVLDIASTGLTVVGDVQMTSQNGGALAGFRNKIINGGCQVAQRAAATLTATPAYGGVDRFMFSNSGSAITQTSAQSGNAVFKNSYCMSLGGSWTTGVTTVYQRMEWKNLYHLRTAGNTLTATATIYHTFGSATNFSLALYKATAADNFTSTTQIGTDVTTSVADSATTTITATFTLALNDAINGLELRLFHASNTVTSKTLLISDIQLEQSSVATPFEQRPYSTELALCQRYYYRVAPGVASAVLAPSGLATSTTNLRGATVFPVTMRAAPTALDQDGTAGDYTIVRGGLATSAACTGVPTFAQANIYHAMTDFPFSTATLVNGTAGYPILTAGTTTGYLGWSAEL